MPEKQPLKGKSALITGGTRGIGLAIALALAERGCRVMITGRNIHGLKASVRAAGISPQRIDVSVPAEVRKLFAGVRKLYGGLDILVNNAGVAHPLTSIEQLSFETWKHVIDTNLTGMFLCTRDALPVMRAGGMIVNNLSVAAIKPFEGMAAYNASKAGALGFTNVLREEIRKRRIRVVALLPGATDTAIWNQFWPQAPREKMVSAATVAEAVAHAVILPANTTIEEIRIGPTGGDL